MIHSKRCRGKRETSKAQVFAVRAFVDSEERKFTESLP